MEFVCHPQADYLAAYQAHTKTLSSEKGTMFVMFVHARSRKNEILLAGTINISFLRIYFVSLRAILG